MNIYCTSFFVGRKRKEKKRKKICIDKWLFKTFTGRKVENENQHISNLYGVYF